MLTRKEAHMGFDKPRLYMAGLIAFLLGVPLTEKAFGRTEDIVWTAFDLAGAIADASDGS